MAQIGRFRTLAAGAAVMASLLVFGLLVTATSPALSRCTTAQLKISLAPLSPGLGHAGNVIRFQNRGAACELRGYPGADGIANGKVVVHAKRTLSGYLAGAHKIVTVTLAHGATASAALEGLETSAPNFGACHHYQSLEVTPPNDLTGVRLHPKVTVCYPEVHPVIAGKSGSDRA